MSVRNDLILVTGGSGFVGQTLVNKLVEAGGQSVRVAVRRGGGQIARQVQSVSVGDLSAHTNWLAALKEVKDVIHAAGRVHVMQEGVADPLAEFRRVNVDGSIGPTICCGRSASLCFYQFSEG